MINRLIGFALQQRFMTTCFVLVVAAFGVWCVCTIAIDSFPDVSNVQVQIITEPESMATEEVESLITYPIESAMNGLPKVKQIRSNSSFGLSVVTAIFDDDMDIYLARQLVQQRLNQTELPADSPKPILGPMISSFSNVYMYYLESNDMSLIDLRTVQDWQVAKRLRTVPGVENVVSYGGFVKQYQVIVDPLNLKSFGLSIADVVKAIEENNKNAGGNFIERGDQEVIIRGLARIEKLEDLESIILKSVHGVPVYMKQVADIQIGPAFRRGSASMNGKGEAVTGIVMIRRGANTKAVVERIRKRIKEVRSELQPRVALTPYYDQTELVDRTIFTVEEILLVSSALVVIVLAAMLMHIPCALIVSVVIPLSLLFSFILMKYTGLSANLMTLGAVDFGVIVDAGVVMVENIFRQLAHAGNKAISPKTRLSIVKHAACEVGRPIVFAIFIIIAVYLPLFTLEGVEGKMFHPLACTFIYALIGALLVSLTLVPVLAYWVLRNPVQEKHNPFLDWVNNNYRPLLERAIAAPKATLAIAFGALITSFCIVPLLGSEFIPTLDEGSITLRVRLDPSVSHTTSRKVFAAVEGIIKQFPEVTNVVTRIGRSGMGSDLEGVENADIQIGLVPKKEWKNTKSKEELVNMMAAEIHKIPGLMYSFSQPIADMIDDIVSGLRADVGIKIYGDDMEVIDAISSKIQGVVRGVKGAADVNRELSLGLPQLTIKIDRQAIARYGLNAADVQRIVEVALAGSNVTEVVEGTKRFDVMVRLSPEYRSTPEAIGNILVPTPSGGQIPLKSLAIITERKGLVMVNREDGQRRTAVLVNIRGRDLGSFVNECQKKISEQVQIPKGYRIVWGGQFENQQRAMARLSIVVPIVLALIFVLLFSSFGSLKNAALVMLNVPFAMIGGIVALLISRQVLSVPAVIGFIALFGIAVQNGVILVSYIMQLEQKGTPLDRAVREGAYVRLRPVLMTALVATVGLIPKVFADGTGAEIQRPLATVILGGLVSATALTLIVLPSAYAMINKERGTHSSDHDVEVAAASGQDGQG